MTVPMTDQAFEYLLERAGLTLTEAEKADLRTVVDGIAAMAERVRKPRGIMAEPALIYGFSEEDLANAQPNGAELEKMKSYAATAADAGKLADGGKLETRPLAYFDENGKALKDKNGASFAGIDGTGTWMVALVCGNCRNPAPLYMTILKPCST